MEEDAFQSLAGQLLIAAPSLVDPNFWRTVVLVLDHEPEGANGVVLNRPGEQEARPSVPALADVLGEDERIHEGGPVQPEAVIALADYAAPPEGAMVVVGSIG